MDRDKIHISGSEVAAILGLSKWDSPIDIYMRKLGLLEPKPESEPMRWGTAAEHVVARRYAKQMGYNLFPSMDIGFDRMTPLVHPDYPWWRGTPDRKIHGPNDDWGLLEIKIIGERSAADFGEPPDGEVPDAYLCQMAWYFPLIGAEWGDLAVQVGNRDFRIYRIKRDHELENQMRDAALTFIENHLVPEIPPPIDGSESSRHYLSLRYPQDTEPLLEVPQDSIIVAWVNQYREGRERLKQTEAEVSQAENWLKEQIGNHAGLQGGFGKVLWKRNKDSEVVDTKAMTAAHPEIAAQFKTMRPGARVFRAYWKED